nr:DedA family protein [Streptomyces sp. P9(2023)]
MPRATSRCWTPSWRSRSIRRRSSCTTSMTSARLVASWAIRASRASAGLGPRKRRASPSSRATTPSAPWSARKTRKVSDIERTEAWFVRHGTKAVFFGRMVPIFRSLISVPAGVERMPLPAFLLFTTLGSAIWNTAFVLAGYALGDNWEEVTGYVSVYSKAVLVVAAVAVLCFVVTRLLRPGRGARRGNR